jgi:hypothetical protein
MTASTLLTRRLLHGDIQTIREGKRVFVPYDSLVLVRNLNGMSVELRGGKAVLASMDIPNMPVHDTYHIKQLEGRMEVWVEEAQPPFRPSWYA